MGAFQAARDHLTGVVPPAEDRYFSAGDRNPLIQQNSGVVAVSICADSGHESHPQRAAQLGASTYVSAQFAIPLHMGFKLARLKAAALTHGMAIAFSNFTGTTGGLRSAGGSAIYSQHGERVVRLGEEDEGVAIGIEQREHWVGEVVKA